MLSQFVNLIVLYRWPWLFINVRHATRERSVFMVSRHRKACQEPMVLDEPGERESWLRTDKR
jgi:hypothetical protein